MKVIRDGKSYLLESPDGSEQQIEMMRAGWVGTTNEEVIDMLIHRISEQAKDMPCEEDDNLLAALKCARVFQVAALDRIRRED